MANLSLRKKRLYKKNRIYTKNRLAAYGFLAPTFILFSFIFIVPIFFVVGSSFVSWNLLNPGAGIRFIGFQNYLSLLRDPHVWNSFINTFVFTIFSVPISMGIGLGLALAVETLGRSRKMIEALLLLPMMVSPIAIFLSFRFMFEPSFGTVNKFLALFGIQGPGWFSSMETAMMSVIIVDIWRVSPFVFIVTYAALKMLSREPVEAAKVDGANAIQSFRFVVMPLIKPALLVILIVRIMDAIRAFDNILMLTRGGPANSTRTIQFISYELSFEALNMGRGSAMAVLIVLVIIIVGYALIHAMNRINDEIV